jgi:hypothetical protein
MKIPVQLQKIISVLMSFIMMIEFSGCYTQRILSTSDVTPDNYFLIHCKEVAYTAYNASITDGILSGSIDFNTKNLTNPKYIHIYLSSDSSLKINNNQFTLPVTSIREINQNVRDQKKTRTLITLLIVGVSAGLVIGLTIALVSAFRTPAPQPPDGQDWCEYLESIEACSDGSPD